MKFFVSLLILWVSSIALCEAANDPQLQSLLQEGLKRGYPGIAVLIREKDGSIRSAATGNSDLEKGIALKVDDFFHICSVNKTFTAAVALHFVDQKQLSMNATLTQLLGDAVARIPDADKITVAQLLDHSSGIYPTNNNQDYLATVIGIHADPRRVWTSKEMIALADKERNKPAAAPGAGHHYSDTNYILLGMIAEKVSGKPFKQVVREILFEPLGMKSTYFYSDFLKSESDPPVKTIQGYLLATKDIRSVIQIHPMFKPVANDKRTEGELLNTTLAAERIDAAAGIITTLSDLMKFAAALFHGKLLSKESQDFLMAVRTDMGKTKVGTDRTWTLQAVHKPYGVLLYKTGDGPGGVNTLMAYDPASNRIFLGFMNIFGYFNEIEFLMDDVIGKLEIQQ